MNALCAVCVEFPMLPIVFFEIVILLERVSPVRDKHIHLVNASAPFEQKAVEIVVIVDYVVDAFELAVVFEFVVVVVIVAVATAVLVGAAAAEVYADQIFEAQFSVDPIVVVPDEIAALNDGQFAAVVYVAVPHTDVSADLLAPALVIYVVPYF